MARLPGLADVAIVGAGTPAPRSPTTYRRRGLSVVRQSAARALAGLVADGSWDGFGLEVLDPGRFARGQLVASRYGYSVVG